MSGWQNLPEPDWEQMFLKSLVVILCIAVVVRVLGWDHHVADFIENLF